MIPHASTALALALATAIGVVSPAASGVPPSPGLRRVAPEFAWLQRVTADENATGIQRAAWLQGCWEASSPARTVEEMWTSPKGGNMIGVGRTIRNGKLAAYEMIILREQGDRLEYEAHPSGQPVATFLSTRVSASELVFENPAHDFPQQVGYRLDGDTLNGWIRGTQDGKERFIEFRYKRAQCGS